MKMHTSRIIVSLMILSSLISLATPVYTDTINPDVNFYESIIQQHGAIMLLIDPISGEIVFANNEAASFYGYSVDTLQSMRMNQINTLSDESIAQEMQLANLEQRNYFLFKHILNNDQIRDVEVYSYPVVVDGRMLLFSVINDVTEKIAMEGYILKENQRLLTITLIIATIFLLGLVILFRSNRDRKKAIKSLDALYDIQQKISKISLRFARAEANQIDILFKETLDECGTLLNIDRSFLCLIEPNKKTRIISHSWHRTSLAKDSISVEDVKLNELPWLFDQLVRGQAVYINDISQLPNEAAAEMFYFTKHGLKAKCVIPLKSGDDLIAIWAMDSIAGPVDWENENEELRNVLTSLFAAALDSKQSHDNLVFWKNLLDYIIQHDPNSIAVLDNNMTYMFTSKRYLTDFRIKKTNVVGSNHYEIFPEIPERWRQIHQRVLHGATEQSDDEVFLREDGSVDYTRYRLIPWFLKDDTVGGIILYLEVINERKRKENELIESEERFRLLVETAPDAIFLVAGRTIAYANQAAVKMLQVKSVEYLIGRTVMSWLHNSFKTAVDDRYKTLLEDRMPVPPMEQIYVLPDGSEIFVEVKATPIQYQNVNGALVYVRDIDERKKRENQRIADLLQFRQQQKLESIGTLASGVAHEINNPIMGVINYAQLIIDEKPSDNITAFAQEIIDESNRISSITSDLLFFSRQQHQNHSPADIYDIIRRTISLIGGALKKDQIEIQLIHNDLPTVKCRSQQIQQILMNLLTNARDALNEKYSSAHPDKKILLSTELYVAHDRRWIKITVEDRGNGIPESIREKMFNPFFTTKPRDIGTGLGLPISYGIARDHHGRLEFDTVEGQFTKFNLHLPVDNGWGTQEVEKNANIDS